MCRNTVVDITRLRFVIFANKTLFKDRLPSNQDYIRTYRTYLFTIVDVQWLPNLTSTTKSYSFHKPFFVYDLN